MSAASAISVDRTTREILAEQRFLRRLALNLAPRDADADDLVQETLLRAYLARERFRPGTSMRAWLATILRRLFLTARAKDTRRATLTDTDAGEPLHLAGRAEAAPGFAQTTRFDAAMEQVDDALRAAFMELPENYRRPLVLFALSGLSYAEIACQLRVPIGTVMSRIHRGRERVKKHLRGPALAAG